MDLGPMSVPQAASALRAEPVGGLALAQRLTQDGAGIDASGVTAAAELEPRCARRDRDDAGGTEATPEVGPQERHREEGRVSIRGPEPSVEDAVHHVHRF